MTRTNNTAPRVMVIDDSVAQIRFICRTLANDGYDCIPVTNGSDAFDTCVAFEPAAILLDVQLPGVDGLTICRQLKAAPETRLTPVLVMTGHASQERYLSALDAGADDFLTKPIALTELHARVRSAVRMKGYVDELDDAAASIVMLGATIEARDYYTEGHCHRLGDYASRLGRRIGLMDDDLRALDRGGFLHDLGKIAIPDSILFKPGRLDAAEFAQIKTHPLVGDRICSPLRSLERVRPIIRSHHETLDGRGYPDGLHGNAVPLLAQIMGVVDVYDALTTDRPYRRALSKASACETLIAECSAGRRDRQLVNEFILLLESTPSNLADWQAEPLSVVRSGRA
ncbi:MAG: HD domain-containing phosphohydrolase [Vicinamibacterales bacterium]